MGKVEATFTGQEEFTPDRRHRIEQVDISDAFAGQRFGRHQAGRTPTNNRDNRKRLFQKREAKRHRRRVSERRAMLVMGT